MQGGPAAAPKLRERCTREDVAACLAHASGCARVPDSKLEATIAGSERKVKLHELHNVLQQIGGVKEVGVPLRKWQHWLLQRFVALHLLVLHSCILDDRLGCAHIRSHQIMI